MKRILVFVAICLSLSTLGHCFRDLTHEKLNFLATKRRGKQYYLRVLACLNHKKYAYRMLALDNLKYWIIHRDSWRFDENDFFSALLDKVRTQPRGEEFQKIVSTITSFLTIKRQGMHHVFHLPEGYLAEVIALTQANSKTRTEIASLIEGGWNQRFDAAAILNGLSSPSKSLQSTAAVILAYHLETNLIAQNSMYGKFGEPILERLFELGLKGNAHPCIAYALRLFSGRRKRLLDYFKIALRSENHKCLYDVLEILETYLREGNTIDDPELSARLLVLSNNASYKDNMGLIIHWLLNNSPNEQVDACHDVIVQNSP